MDFRIFSGAETRQVNYDGETANPDQWYFEPTDYDGDVLWSSGFSEQEGARQEAMGATHNDEGAPKRRKAPAAG